MRTTLKEVIKRHRENNPNTDYIYNKILQRE